MLSNFLSRQQKKSVKGSQENTESQEVENHDEWIEKTADDVMTIATNDNLTHQQRYENRKKRIYSKHKQIKD